MAEFTITMAASHPAELGAMLVGGGMAGLMADDAGNSMYCISLWHDLVEGAEKPAEDETNNVGFMMGGVMHTPQSGEYFSAGCAGGNCGNGPSVTGACPDEFNHAEKKAEMMAEGCWED